MGKMYILDKEYELIKNLNISNRNINNHHCLAHTKGQDPISVNNDIIDKAVGRLSKELNLEMINRLASEG